MGKTKVFLVSRNRIKDIRHDLLTFVMAGQSRSKNGVTSLAYVPAIHVSLLVS